MVERSYNHQINVMIARYVPGLAESVARTFALAEAPKLRSLFDAAGFVDFATNTVGHAFVLPSFDAYYGPFERGGGSTGQALAALSEDIRRAVREEARRDLSDTGGPINRKPSTELAVDSGKECEGDPPYATRGGRLRRSAGQVAVSGHRRKLPQTASAN